MPINKKPDISEFEDIQPQSSEFEDIQTPANFGGKAANVSLIDRFVAQNLKKTPEDRIKYYESKYPGSQFIDFSGQIFKKEGNQWNPVDPSFLGSGSMIEKIKELGKDITDIGYPLASTLATIGAQTAVAPLTLVNPALGYGAVLGAGGLVSGGAEALRQKLAGEPLNYQDIGTQAAYDVAATGLLGMGKTIPGLIPEASKYVLSKASFLPKKAIDTYIQYGKATGTGTIPFEKALGKEMKTLGTAMDVAHESAKPVDISKARQVIEDAINVVKNRHTALTNPESKLEIEELKNIKNQYLPGNQNLIPADEAFAIKQQLSEYTKANKPLQQIAPGLGKTQANVTRKVSSELVKGIEESVPKDMIRSYKNYKNEFGKAVEAQKSVSSFGNSPMGARFAYSAIPTLLGGGIGALSGGETQGVPNWMYGLGLGMALTNPTAMSRYLRLMKPLTPALQYGTKFGIQNADSKSKEPTISDFE